MLKYLFITRLLYWQAVNQILAASHFPHDPSLTVDKHWSSCWLKTNSQCTVIKEKSIWIQATGSNKYSRCLSAEFCQGNVQFLLDSNLWSWYLKYEWVEDHRQTWNGFDLTQDQKCYRLKFSYSYAFSVASTNQAVKAVRMLQIHSKDDSKIWRNFGRKNTSIAPVKVGRPRNKLCTGGEDSSNRTQKWKILWKVLLLERIENLQLLYSWWDSTGAATTQRSLRTFHQGSSQMFCYIVGSPFQ